MSKFLLTAIAASLLDTNVNAETVEWLVGLDGYYQQNKPDRAFDGRSDLVVRGLRNKEMQAWVHHPVPFTTDLSVVTPSETDQVNSATLRLFVIAGAVPGSVNLYATFWEDYVSGSPDDYPTSFTWNSPASQHSFGPPLITFEVTAEDVGSYIDIDITEYARNVALFDPDSSSQIDSLGFYLEADKSRVPATSVKFGSSESITPPLFSADVTFGALDEGACPLSMAQGTWVSTSIARNQQIVCTLNIDENGVMDGPSSTCKFVNTLSAQLQTNAPAIVGGQLSIEEVNGSCKVTGALNPTLSPADEDTFEFYLSEDGKSYHGWGRYYTGNVFSVIGNKLSDD